MQYILLILVNSFIGSWIFYIGIWRLNYAVVYSLIFICFIIFWNLFLLDKIPWKITRKNIIKSIIIAILSMGTTQIFIIIWMAAMFNF